MNGFLVTFEGIDCAGKSTQANRLYTLLRDANVPCLLVRNPGDTNLGCKVRHMVKHDHMQPTSRMFLFAAALNDLCKRRIKPALDEGKIVICDRYTDSSFAYQVADAEEDFGYEMFVENVNRHASMNMIPDITFLLDIPEDEMRRRLGMRMDEQMGKEDIFESKSNTFFKKVRENYAYLASTNDNIEKIDATASRDDVAQQICDVFLQKHNGRAIQWNKPTLMLEKM